MKNNTFSIVTAVYNGADFIEDNILSVKNQDYPAIEHIIIDGGSKDGTVDIIKKYAGTYNLKWVSEKDRGVYDAFNKGFTMATGDVYAWLDGDNYFRPNIIGVIAGIFQQDPSIDIVHGDIEMVSHDGKPINIYKAPAVSFRNALIKNTGAIPLQPAAFFKKDLYKKSGGFDLRYPVAADHDFWLKVLKDNPKVYCYNGIVGSYRRGNATNSQSLRGISRGMKEMLSIGDVYGQPYYAKLLLVAKYALSFLSALKKRILQQWNDQAMLRQ